MSFCELKSWLNGRLQLRGVAAADVDRRTGETPYAYPLAEWQQGEESFRQRLARACVALLEEVNGSGWQVEHIHNLATLIDEAGMECARESLTSIVYSRSWQRGPDGDRRHMLALRTLLGLGWKGTPEFWEGQDGSLIRKYPELIFRGLLAHGIEIAFSRLPQLAVDGQSFRRLLWLFPSLIESEGLERVRGAVSKRVSLVSSEVRAALDDWFGVRGYGRVGGEDDGESITLAHCRALGTDISVLDSSDPGWDVSATDPQGTLGPLILQPQGA